MPPYDTIWYLTYTPKFDRFGYYSGASHKLIHIATDKSREWAKSILMHILRKRSPGAFRFGDMVVDRNDETFLVLDNGHSYSKNTDIVRYLVFNQQKQVCEYRDLPPDTTERTSVSYDRAKKILLNQILAPAFA